jgi:hypothetical protein
VLALLALIVIGVIWQMRQRNEQPMELVPLKSIPSGPASTDKPQAVASSQ